MNREDIETAVSLTGKSIATLGAIGAVVMALIPRARRAFAAYCAASDLAATFGRDAGVVLKRLMISKGEKISQTQAMTEALSRAINLGLYVCDSEGKCIGVNAILEQWLGISSEHCRGYGWLAGILDRENAFRVWSFSMKNGIPYKDNYEIKNVHTGEIIKVTTEAVQIEIEGGSIYVGFVRKL